MASLARISPVIWGMVISVISRSKSPAPVSIFSRALPRIGAARNLIAQPRQHAMAHIDQIFFIVHKQNRFMATGQRLVLDFQRLVLTGGGGQQDAEGTALARPAFGADGAPVAADDAVNHCQSHAGAFALGLGGVVGLEDPFDLGWADAVTGILDPYFQVGARRNPVRPGIPRTTRRQRCPMRSLGDRPWPPWHGRHWC